MRVKSVPMDATVCHPPVFLCGQRHQKSPHLRRDSCAFGRLGNAEKSPDVGLQNDAFNQPGPAQRCAISASIARPAAPPTRAADRASAARRGALVMSVGARWRISKRLQTRCVRRKLAIKKTAAKNFIVTNQRFAYLPAQFLRARVRVKTMPIGCARTCPQRVAPGRKQRSRNES